MSTDFKALQRKAKESRKGRSFTIPKGQLRNPARAMVVPYKQWCAWNGFVPDPDVVEEGWLVAEGPSGPVLVGMSEDEDGKDVVVERDMPRHKEA